MSQSITMLTLNFSAVVWLTIVKNTVGSKNNKKSEIFDLIILIK